MTTNNMKSKPKDKKDSHAVPGLTEFGLEVSKALKKLFAVSGIRIDGAMLRRRPDKWEIIQGAAEYVEDPRPLIEAVKGDPSIMKTDRRVIVALMMLQIISAQPRGGRSRRAADILRKIGRQDLLPRTTKGKLETFKSDDPYYHLWRGCPEDFREEVGDYAERLLALFRECPNRHKHGGGGLNAPKSVWRPRGRDAVYDCCLDYAFKIKVGSARPSWFKKATPTTATDFPSLMALRFLSFEHGSSFHSLYDLYFRKKETSRETVEEERARLERESLDKESGFALIYNGVSDKPEASSADLWDEAFAKGIESGFAEDEVKKVLGARKE